MSMKMKVRTLLTVIFFTCICTFVNAQGDPGDDPDPSVPIDGGLSLLIAAGVGYAAKKGYDKRKKDKSEDYPANKEK
jgi:hypothetical protein